MFESGVLGNLEAGRFSSLRKIHRFLFEDIYYFAGEIRDINIAKGNFRFAPLMFLEAALTDKTDDRDVYMKGIDHSYYYEGYTTYKTTTL